MKMKKALAITLCSLMAVSAAACSDKSVNSSDNSSSIDTVQTPNPFIPCDTLEDAAKIAGFDITVPESITGYGTKEISAIEKEMIQVIFSDGDNKTYFRKGLGNEDISGDFNEYSSVKKVEIDGFDVTVYGDGDTVNTAVWYDGDFSYAILCGEAADLDTVISYVEAMGTSIAQIPNPFTDSSTLEEAEKLVGFDITVPDSIDGLTERIYRSSDFGMLEILYTNNDETKACVRKAVGTDDISGDYNVYSDITEETVDGKTVTFKGDNSNVSLAIWTDGEYTYSVSLDSGNKELMTNLVQYIK